MALIKCPECGKEFSETANVCPQCGYRKRSQEVRNQIKENNNFAKKYWWIFVVIGLIAGIIVFLQNL